VTVCDSLRLFATASSVVARRFLRIYIAITDNIWTCLTSCHAGSPDTISLVGGDTRIAERFQAEASKETSEMIMINNRHVYVLLPCFSQHTGMLELVAG